MSKFKLNHYYRDTKFGDIIQIMSFHKATLGLPKRVRVVYDPQSMWMSLGIRHLDQDASGDLETFSYEEVGAVCEIIYGDA